MPEILVGSKLIVSSAVASIANQVNVISKYDVKTILLLNSVALGNDVLPSWERVYLPKYVYGNLACTA